MSVKLSFSIPVNTCDEGLAIWHYGPVIINSNARVGKFCEFHVGVNIGKDSREGKAPIIGNHCYLGPGSKLFGIL